MKLKGKTALITGSSRGIGRAMALGFAKEGANIIVTGKTDTPHPKLEGTIHTVAEEIQALGVEAMPYCLDVRNEDAIQEMVVEIQKRFGQLDILVNNASAINVANTQTLQLKHFDLMYQINVRGTFACSKACIPLLKLSSNPHIITMSPPINLDPKWFKDHVAYTITKYGMSMCTLGMSEELKPLNIAVNSLWPRTTIATAAIKNLFPPQIYAASRLPDIVALAAEYIVQENSKEFTGQFLIDEEYLRTKGVKDFEKFALDKRVPLQKDFFLDD